ncbi:hypothetical protein AQUCO_06700031v1 [Aquilegia coerulea]|nr:hypothetical protein AQUCO_06700031v1 [Aquilegia coerulea]
MAETTDSSYSSTQRLVTENEKNPSKFNSHFYYKAFSVAIVLVILPLFPSQAPEFINQTIFTRSWELVHLLFVGIAVSYGLFSRRNFETEKENQLKIDSTQTYMSRILQVSNVFDDEIDIPFGSNENNAQTWNSNYFRGEPVVVVEEETPVLDEQSNTISNVGKKPLFLPVRSLRSSVSDSDSVESIGESIESLGSLSRSASGSKNGSEKTRSREFGDLDPLDLEEKLKESVVLPSPIPWRSRSGRLEMKEEISEVNPPPYTLPPSVDEPEFDQHEFQSFPSPVRRSSQANSTSPSPKRHSPSPSVSPELRGKNIEDLGKKKKNAYKSSPPPPPPLPTPISRKSPSFLSNSRSVENGFPSERKVVKKSFKDELKDVRRSGTEEFPRVAEFGSGALKSEANNRSHFEASSIGKSVRTFRGSESIAESKNYREFEERMDMKSEKRLKEVDREYMDKPKRKPGGFNQQPTSTDNQPRATPKPTLPKYHKKEKKRLAQKVILESEEYSSSEADDSQGGSDTEQAASDSVSDSGRDPNEVDKKADEFIAKFREQIRLQRIESIKRSSGQHR